MNLELTEDMKDIQDLARKFAEKIIKPAAAEYDNSEAFPWEIIKKAHALGLMNLRVPVEYGGTGLDNFNSCLAMEEMSAACAGIASVLSVNNLAVEPILTAGTSEQKEKFLKFLCAEPRLAAFAITEPEVGSDVASITTTAKSDGDSYILNGRKCFISNGSHAELYIVFASTNLSKKSKGITAFIVPRGTPGLIIGKSESKMGLRASDISEIIFDNMRVPAENRLGKEGEGLSIASKALDFYRPEVAAGAVGIAHAALEASIAYSKERVTFGKPICANQSIQTMLADMATDVKTARLMVWSAAWMADTGKNCEIQGAMAKCRASDAAVKVTSDALQIFGGYGYMRENLIEKLVRDARIYQIFYGTNQMNRMIIAKGVLE